MKHLILITLLFSSLHFYGNYRKTAQYRIVTDTESDTVSEGYTIITGIAYKSYPGNANTERLNEAVISTVDHKYRATTNKKGKYVLRIPSEKAGLYFFKPRYHEIVISSYQFKSKHIVEIDFYGSDEKQNTQVKKPVIYLYPEEEKKYSIELSPVGNITFTYPIYKNGWNVTATPEGVIKDETGKEYPYLFWEAEQKELDYIETEKGLPGFVISKGEVIPFLEKQLSQIGLNDKESTDFITYWGPILQRNKYALVQFLIDEDYNNKIGTIKTQPNMQTVKRVYILCSEISSVEEVPGVIPQVFVPFERVGSTLLEWGGSEINIIRITN